ncbi:hypothetical protein LY76DRAFT_32814 [Colletotrichum caudatum]|nr:hypothetical protein LY76DRAFT_32814 [Colletotrichum caudatum]
MYGTSVLVSAGAHACPQRASAGSADSAEVMDITACSCGLWTGVKQRQLKLAHLLAFRGVDLRCRVAPARTWFVLIGNSPNFTSNFSGLQTDKAALGDQSTPPHHQGQRPPLYLGPMLSILICKVTVYPILRLLVTRPMLALAIGIVEATMDADEGIRKRGDRAVAIHRAIATSLNRLAA